MAEPGTAAPAPPRDPVSSKDDEPTATASTPNETTEAHPAATESEGQPAEAEPAPATATPSPGPTELPKQAETTPAKQERPASSKPSANTVRVRNARKPSGARRMWLMFAGAFALGMLGYLALSQQEEVATTPSLPTPTTSATATATPTIVPAPLAGTAPAIATATSKASTRPAKAAGLAKTESATAPAKPAGKPSSLGSSSASSIARETSTGTASADPQRAAALARKCIDTDDGGKGKTRAVAGVCRTALEADPNNAGVMLILARAEIDRGRLVEAKTLAKKALTTAPDRLDAYVLLGTAEQEAGHLDEAESAYRKYLELAPDGPYAKELRAILDNL
jgi:Flp pilus assembly protein TadD